MLTSAHVAQARPFAASPRGGFSIPDVDRLVARVVATLASYEGTGTPGREGLTATSLGNVVLPSVFAERGYAMLEVQDFLDAVHETLATYEQRDAFPASAVAATSWVPAADTDAPAGSGVLAQSQALGRISSQDRRPVPSVPIPTNVAPAIRALASVGSGRPPAVLPAGPSGPPPPPVAPSAPAAAPAPARDYGMDADALIFELQSAVAQSRARGTLQVSVQVPGQQLRVMRVVETAPGSITIVAQ